MPGKPGVATHVPKRSEQRRRRNKVEIDRAANRTEKRGPDAPDDLTGLALVWYESLRTSGQSVFYADSDWASALIVARAVARFEERPSAHMLTAILSSFGSLAVTEGDRRRLRIELERADGAKEDGDVSELDDYRARLRTSS